MKSVITRLAVAALCVAAISPVAAQDALQSYIVVLQPGTANVPEVAAEVARAYGGQPGFVYQHALRGFSIKASPQAAAAIASSPRVSYVERDMPRSIHAQTMPTGIRRAYADTNPNLDIDGADDYRVDVDVAVIDTGIDRQHPDLNVVGGINCAAGIFVARCSGDGDDDHYHGTHVAGTIAALDNDIGVVGVAPGARLWAVKVLNSKGSGYSSWIVAGIDWVAARAGTIEVANMSLGGSGYSQAEYDAIQGAVSKGVAFAVSAGNSDADARNYSPASFDNVLTVSALADFDGQPGGQGAATCRTDQDDTLADFSNWGSVVDIAAPGVCILSTYPIEQGSYGTISGTSMASPHAAGGLALLASRNNPGTEADVKALYAALQSAGNFAWTDDSGDGLQEPLLDVSNTSTFAPALVAGSGGTTPNNPPVAAFTKVCTGLSCTFTDASTDGDGSVVAWSWAFGDGQVSMMQNPSHSYVSGGTYTVSLTVTDDDGATATSSQQFTVAAAPADFTLNVRAYKVKSTKYADLTWSGATGTNVDVYRNGSVVITTPNDGAYKDNPPKTVSSATYKVCEAGTSTCSNEVTVTW